MWYIFFWGTVYRLSDGDLYVRCLKRGYGEWDWNYSRIDSDFYGRSPVALCAS